MGARALCVCVCLWKSAHMKTVRVRFCLRQAKSVCRKDSLYVNASGGLICLYHMHLCV